MTPDTQAPHVQQAAEALAAQAARFMRAAQSLTRTALRLATTDQPTKVLQALAKYQQADLPEPELVAEVSALIEGTQPPAWREARAKRHLATDRYRMGRDLSGPELPIEGLPDWGPAMVLRIAREKADVLSAASDAIERGSDGNGEILRHLTNYMAGRYGAEALRIALGRAGIDPGSNVVPLFRGGRS
jgi:hypothetical protein